MKIIFSRKGFDDAYGGGASPILPDGKLLSLPIPVKKKEKGVNYDSIYYNGKSFKKIMAELGIKAKSKCHLDPDLELKARTALPNWQAAFGQQGAAAKHLINEEVEAGDLFLFFGSFKRTYLTTENKLQFENDFARHIIFGHLLVGEIIDRPDQDERAKANLDHHPHVQNDYGKNNLLFMASTDRSQIPISYGSYHYDPKLVLTRLGFRKSVWDLPICFHPDEGTRISRHLKKSRFGKRGNSTILQTIGIGQDFVVKSKSNDVEKWALELVENSLAR